MALNEDVLVTTVLSPAATYALTDLETAKDELKIAFSDSTDNTWLTRAISQVSRAIMNETNRVFAPEYVQDAFDIRRRRTMAPIGPRGLQLSRWPVLAIASIVQNTLLGPVSLDAADYEVDFRTGELYRLDPDSGLITAWAPVPTVVKYTAGYGAAIQETHTVPATPFAVTVGQANAFSCDQLVTYANGTALTPVAASPAQGQYTVAAGLYTFAAADVGQTLTIAYATIALPDDLVDVTMRLLSARYKSRGRDPSLIQRDTQGVGTERFWFGGAPGQTGQFPPDIQALLDNYSVPTVA